MIKNKQIKDIIILIIGKTLKILISLITIRFVTEFLSVEQVGIYYILLTILSVISFSFYEPLTHFFTRHLVRWSESNDLKTVTILLLGVRVLLIPLALMVAFLIYYIFEYEVYYSITNYSFFVIVSILASTHGLLLVMVNVLISRVIFTVYDVLTVLIGLILSLLFINIYNSAISWMYGLAFTQLILSLKLYSILIKGYNFSPSKFKTALNKNYIKGVCYYIIPLTVALFLQWGQLSSYRIIVEDLYTSEVLSYIAVGMTLSCAILSAIESLVNQFYTPNFLRKISGASKQERTMAWNQLANVVIPIYIGITLYIISFAPYLTKLLVAEKYHDAYIYVMIGAIFEFMRVLTNLVYLVSHSELKAKYLVKPYLTGFLLTVFSLYLFDANNSFWKIPVILSLAYMVTFFYMTVNMKKLLPIEFEIKVFLKVIIIMAPMLLVFFINTNDVLISVLLVSFGLLYVVVAQYLFLKDKLEEINKY